MTSSPSRTQPSSSATSTLQSTSATDNVRLQTPEAPASLNDLLKSLHNPALSEQLPSSTLRGASPTDHRRRNGFHLWRTESEDARNLRLRRAMEAAEAQTQAPGSFSDKVTSKLRGVTDWISAHNTFSLYRRPGVDEDDIFPAVITSQKLTRFGLIILTISLAGAQLAWTLELAYGTPYLLSLGLSEQSTSLVWLAGPLSGLIAQPVVGSLSDNSTSSFRRRKYMIISATLLTLSTVALAYSVPVATALVDIFGGGLGDWDPRRQQLVHSTTQWLSVAAFWILDFALNGLQAASRALILDTAPSEQQSVANAWQGRMTHIGNVVGYLCGWVDLASWKGLRWIGGGQFRRFAMISLLAMISCVSVTIGFISEQPSDRGVGRGSWWRAARETVDDVWHAIRRLPRSVRRVCVVQLFAFMGWFPFLFYSTTYVLQIAEFERRTKHKKGHGETLSFLSDESEDGHKGSDHDAERGSFAMLMFALVSLMSAALFPYLSLAGEKRRPTPDEQHHRSNNSTPSLTLDIPPTDTESLAPQHRDPEGDDNLSRVQRILRGLTRGITLRTFWTLASLVFAALMLIGTAWASTVHQATIVIALVGIPWSIAAWAPFAMVGEFVREAEDGASPFEFEGDHWSPMRTRARWASKQRRASIRQPISRPEADSGRVASPSRGGFKYIDGPGSPVAGGGAGGGGERGARARIRASLVDCAPLPHTLSLGTEESGEDGLGNGGGERHFGDADSVSDVGWKGTSGGAGTILGIHNLAIVAPQFVVAIIASLIFRVVNQGRSNIHLVLGDQISRLAPLAFNAALAEGEGSGEVGNPADGTVWVLRFGGTMALAAALATRFVPLTLSERNSRYASYQPLSRQIHDDDDEEVLEE